MFFNWFRRKKIIGRDDVTILLFKSLGFKVIRPLSKKYYLFKNEGDILKSTPRLGRWEEDLNDCDRMALTYMQANSKYAVGMVVVMKTVKMNHCLNIVIAEDKVVRLYDPYAKTFHKPEDCTIKRVWI